MSSKVRNGIIFVMVILITGLIVKTSYGFMSELSDNTPREIAVDKTLTVRYKNTNKLEIGNSESFVIFSVVNNGTLDMMYDIYLIPHNLDENELRDITVVFDGQDYRLSSLNKVDDQYLLYTGAIKKQYDSLDDLTHRITSKSSGAKGNLEVVVNSRAVNDLASDVISSLGYDNNRFGLVKDIKDNVRYVGEDPNNYMVFNDELWRIIGVFKVEDTIDGTEALKVKIVKSEAIGEYVWSNEANLFINSGLYNELNSNYYNNISSKSLIDSAKFKIGEYASITNAMQAASLENIDFSAIVSLPTVADYLYAKDWMNDGWLLGNNANGVDKFFKADGGEVVLTKYNERAWVSPVVYLNSTVRIVDGDGSRIKPFVIQ